MGNMCSCLSKPAEPDYQFSQASYLGDPIMKRYLKHESRMVPQIRELYEEVIGGKQSEIRKVTIQDTVLDEKNCK